MLVLRADAIPAVLEDTSGHACLVVLPSNGPSNRHEAAAVDALLGHMLHDPTNAGALASAWRADTLGALCASSLTSLEACVKGQSRKAAAWQFRRQDRGTSGDSKVHLRGVHSCSLDSVFAVQVALLLVSKLGQCFGCHKGMRTT